MGLGPRILSGGAALFFCSLASASLTVEPLCAASPSSARDAVRLSIGPGGWRPTTIETHKGARLRLIVSAEEGEHCLALDVFRLERRIVAGRETTIDFVPDQVGSFPFYDCLQSGGRRASGRLVVTD